MASPRRRPPLLFKDSAAIAPGQPAPVTFMSEDVGFVDSLLCEGWHRLELILLTGEFVGNPPCALCQVCGEDGYVVDSMIARELWEGMRAGNYTPDLGRDGEISLLDPPVFDAEAADVVGPCGYLRARSAEGADILIPLVRATDGEPHLVVQRDASGRECLTWADGDRP